MKPDALIFDMDGTLWDAVDMYAQSWNEVFKRKGIQKSISRDFLQKLMGYDIKTLLAAIIPEIEEDKRTDFYENVIHEYSNQLFSGEAKIYPGVIDGLKALSQSYKLFMLSNCEKGGIKLFLDYSNTHEYITSYIEHGENLLPKHENMKLLKEKFQLQNPVYIGDTDSDRKSCDLAGVSFIFADYGFGSTDKYLHAFSNFSDLTMYYISLSE